MDDVKNDGVKADDKIETPVASVDVENTEDAKKDDAQPVAPATPVTATATAPKTPANDLDDDLKNLGRAAKAGLVVIGKSILLGLAITVGGAIAGGVLASAAGLGGLAIAASSFVGFVAGSWLGGKAAKHYVSSKSGPAIVVAGKLVDTLNKEAVANGQKPLEIPGLTPKFEDAKAPANDAPKAEAPAVTVTPKAPAA